MVRSRSKNVYRRTVAAIAITLGFVYALESSAAEESNPYVIVLGTAQDGGLPQVGCPGQNCVKARADHHFHRAVSSLLIADPSSGKRWLIDATPDFKEQVERARPHPGTRVEEGNRPALFDGIFLTHAHMGHYTGLLHLSGPAYGANNVPVYVGDRMSIFLSENGPWDLMLREENIQLVPIESREAIALGPNLRITPISVPHRDEYSNTFGFIVNGPNQSLLFIPDIDKWERWDTQIEDVIASVDIAFLDGTFYQDGEIPGRSMADIPHPFIQESIKRFQKLPLAERNKVHFIHLNHTNPAVDPGSEAAKAVASLGMFIAYDGQRVDL
jgi:pyrroloquinoline quinone biosynthesis protein B